MNTSALRECAAALLIMTSVACTDVQEIEKLLPADGAVNDHFGSSVAVHGDTVVVGACGDDDNGDKSGSAYVFTRTRTTWSQQAKLIASDGVPGDCFGRAVAVYGETAVIAAVADINLQRGTAAPTGSAYVFTRTGSTWSLQAKLTPSVEGVEFGHSVAIFDNTVLIGAIAGDGANGSTYVFARTGITWSQQAELTASDGAPSDFFGLSVAISGDTAVIGAPFDDDQGDFSGSVYVFARSGTTWSQQAKLTASDGARADQFGFSVAAAGDTVVIGALVGDENIGAAYAFTRSGTTWSQQAKLTANDGAAWDQFGTSVAISANIAVIGASGDDNRIGSASVFTRAGAHWIGQPKLTASDSAMWDDFGGSVAISGDTAVISAAGDDDNGVLSGSAYVFALENPPGAQ